LCPQTTVNKNPWTRWVARKQELQAGLQQVMTSHETFTSCCKEATGAPCWRVQATDRQQTLTPSTQVYAKPACNHSFTGNPPFLSRTYLLTLQRPLPCPESQLRHSKSTDLCKQHTGTKQQTLHHTGSKNMSLSACSRLPYPLRFCPLTSH
jgi:hypothetical protein